MTNAKYVYTKNEKGEFVCPHCGETKKRQNTMFYHMKKHAGDFTHTCSLCQKGFIQKSGLMQHMVQIHPEAADGAPAYNCPCCEHSCPIKSNLLIHIARRHGAGWIPVATGACTCTGCKKDFSSATAYYYHAASCFPAPADIADKVAPLLPAA
jgi:hypothetical protein